MACISFSLTIWCLRLYSGVDSTVAPYKTDTIPKIVCPKIFRYSMIDSLDHLGGLRVWNCICGLTPFHSSLRLMTCLQ
eukprot:15345435-Ditylum_brightwellii.AAC.1